MGYGTQTVIKRSDEPTFMKYFFSRLKGIVFGSNFTITTPDDSDVDNAYLNNDPTFTVRIDGSNNICTLGFSRIQNTTGTGFDLTITTANQEVMTTSLFFTGSQKPADTEVTRIFKIKYIINPECFYLGLGNHYDDFNSLSWIFFEIKIDGGITARTMIKNSSSSNILNGNFISTSGIVCKRIDRLPYVYDTSNYQSIEKINKKVFIAENTNNKVFEANTLHDVTWITPNLSITINGTNYYSLDNHTIMEI